MGRPEKDDLSKNFVKLLEQIGTNIREIRTEKNFSQAEIARKSGISKNTLSGIETRCRRDIKLETLFDIAKALNITVSDLFPESQLDVHAQDKARLLKASEDLNKVTRKMSKKKGTS